MCVSCPGTMPHVWKTCDTLGGYDREIPVQKMYEYQVCLTSCNSYMYSVYTVESSSTAVPVQSVVRYLMVFLAVLAGSGRRRVEVRVACSSFCGLTGSWVGPGPCVVPAGCFWSDPGGLWPLFWPG